MDHTLDYLRESLSNWVDEEETANRIYNKLENHVYSSEKEFAEALDQDEIQFLSKIVREEIQYADQEKDSVRLSQLNEIFEQLY